MVLKSDSKAAASADSSVQAVDKKIKNTIKYPPYVNAYGSINQLFSEIIKASVPPKFSQDFMSTVLGMKSSSHRALIPLLKRLEFIDANNVPTEFYKEYRGDSGREVLAARLKNAYQDLYKANEYAHNLNKEQLTSKLRSITGAGEQDEVLKSVVQTFLELVKLSNFAEPGLSSQNSAVEKPVLKSEITQQESIVKAKTNTSLGLSYTINLNLPATTEIEVFNAIFKSLREHILDVE